MESRAYGLPGLEWARFVIVPQATKSEPANNFGPFPRQVPTSSTTQGPSPAAVVAEYAHQRARESD